MDLPVSVSALGEQLREAGEIVPDPALFHSPDVFAAERERIFVRPWMAVDHQTRLSEDGHYFRFDVATRSMILSRESGGRLHALRNVCIHAGYQLCDAEEGSAERLICPYHGWEYTLDGRLVEPELSSRIDPARLRLPSYRVCVRSGVIFVDPSGQTEAPETHAEAVPAWLADATVTRRTRHGTAWNWKFAHQFLHSSPQLLADEPPDGTVDFGPLSWMTVGSRQAVLLRIIPKSAEQTDFQVIRMTARDAPDKAGSPAGDDALADGLRRADPSLGWFDQRFGEWYWSLISTT
jgi:nitrite reductase/ring-hydroxylating ferredoxin subunit